MSNYGYLAHHGVKGQKWGIRRYQNPDGSLTAEGRERYGIGSQISTKNAVDFMLKNGRKKNAFGFLKKDNPFEGDFEKRANEDKTGIYKGIYNLITDINETKENLVKEQKNLRKIEEKEVDKYFDREDVKKEFLNWAKDEFGSFKQVDDRDYLKYEIGEFIARNQYKAYSDKTRKKSKEYSDKLNAFENERIKIVKNYIDSITKGKEKLGLSNVAGNFKTTVENTINHIYFNDLGKRDEFSYNQNKSYDDDPLVNKYYDLFKNR